MSFIKKAIAEIVIQLGTFSTNIKGSLGTKLGFSDDDKIKIENDYIYMQWVAKNLDAIESFASSYVAYQHLVRYGAKNVTAIVEPVFPVFGTPPTIVEAGIQHRFSANAAIIKANPACTLDIQKQLGIAPDETALTKGDESPDLKVKDIAGYPVVSFHKYDNDGINLYRDKGDGKGYGSLPYKTLFFSPFTDKDIPAIGFASTIKYKAVYLTHDLETSKFSPEISMTIAGR